MLFHGNLKLEKIKTQLKQRVKRSRRILLTKEFWDVTFYQSAYNTDSPNNVISNTIVIDKYDAMVN